MLAIYTIATFGSLIFVIRINFFPTAFFPKDACRYSFLSRQLFFGLVMSSM